MQVGMEAHERQARPVLHISSSAGRYSIEPSTRSSLQVSLVCPLSLSLQD